jgi:hypothetical protein
MALSAFPALKRLLKRVESRFIRILATPERIVETQPRTVIRSPRIERVIADLERERRRRRLSPPSIRR